MVDARMDGTPLEKAQWRILALREALQDILTTDDCAAAHAFARNAVGVDNDNALRGKHEGGNSDRSSGGDARSPVSGVASGTIGAGLRANGIPCPLYTMSEPHLSGYRVVAGFSDLASAQQFHDYIATKEGR